jgi:hypothetical protein
MDIRCPICGEPWDMDELHDNDEGLSYTEAAAVFRTEGCGAVFGGTCKPTNRATSDTLAAIYDLMGDDMDGCASMIEDAEMMGLL